METRLKIASARTPDKSEMILYQHGNDFTIMVNGQDLMLSRQHESELELARLGCAHLVAKKSPRTLIGGLGMGYTLRQTLDILSPDAQVFVSELLDSVIEWNRDFLGDLNGKPIGDKRVVLKKGDIVELLLRSKRRFDAILLDVDNGPGAMTDSGNSRLYSNEGVKACRRALRKNGCLAVWSAEPSKEFEQLLMSCGFHVRRYRAPAYKGSKSQSHFIWLASENQRLLPDGGGEPRKPLRKLPRGGRR